MVRHTLGPRFNLNLTTHLQYGKKKKNRVRLMYVSVDGCAFWPPSTLQQQRWKKKWTNHLVQCECCMLEYEHLFRHHPGADSARAQVRPEQHTLISVFKLNSCKLCQLNIKSQRMRARARSEKICACAHLKCANQLLRTRANIKLSLNVLCLNGQIRIKIVKMLVLVSIS